MTTDDPSDKDPVSRLQTPLLACLLIILILAFVVFRYFLLTFTVAAAVAILLGPLQRGLSARLGGRGALSAALLVLLCAILILIPLLSYGTLLSQQLVTFATWLGPRLKPDELQKVWKELLSDHPIFRAWVQRSTGINLMSILSLGMTRLASSADNIVQAIVGGLASATLDVTILLMMVFFLLRDGDQLRELLRGISPLTRVQESELVNHLTKTIKGVLLSMIIVPIVQGLVALAGFAIFGVPSPILWSVMVVFAAVIPIVGSPLAWVPAAVYLLLSGSRGAGIGLLLYGTFVISMIDNLVKPIILRGMAQIHTMLGFLSILGGLYAFGPKGLVVGPVILSLVLSAYRIYRYDVLRWRQDGEVVNPLP